MKNVHFAVNAEDMCVMARHMLWEENHNLDDCLVFVEDLLMNPSVDDEERRHIAIEILEGRKILRGVNEAELEEDGKHIRPISELVRRKEQVIYRHGLRDHMERFPYLYIDHGVGGYSLFREIGRNWFEGHIPEDIQRMSIDELKRMRIHGVSSDELIGVYGACQGELEAGTYLLDNPELAYEILKKPVSKPNEATDRCTAYFHALLQEWKRDGLTYKEMNAYEQAVYERNAVMDKEFPYAQDKLADRLKGNEKELNIPIPSPSTIKKEEVSINETGMADTYGEFASDVAWISPQGLYYSCDFARHQEKSHYIVEQNPSLLAEIQTIQDSLYALVDDDYPSDYQLTDAFLLLKGWGKLHDPTGIGMLRFTVDDNRGATFAQIATIQHSSRHFKRWYDPLTYSYVRIEEEAVGLTGWLSNKGEFFECEWGNHAVFAKKWTDEGKEHTDSYLKMGCNNDEYAYLFFPSNELPFEQEHWIKKNWLLLHPTQQQNYLDYKESLEPVTTIPQVETIKEDYERWKRVFKRVYEQEKSKELHDWLALETQLLSLLRGKDEVKMRRTLLKWEALGHYLNQ